MRGRFHRAAWLCAAVVAVSGCGGEGTAERAAAGRGGDAAARAAASPPAKLIPGTSRAARTRAAALPIAQAAAQLVLAGFEGTDFQAPVFASLRESGLGGIVVAAENAATPEAVAAMAGEAVAAAGVAGRVPPLVASADGVEAAGVTLSLGPVADLAVSAGPAAETGASDDPREAAAAVRAAVRESLAAGVMPAVGHFPGQGAASQDPLDGPASVGVSARDLAARDLVPFRAAIRAGVPAVVVSSAAYTAYDPVTPAALVPAITRDLLRRELRFAGVAMSADLGGLAAATGSAPEDVAVEAIRAGIDLVYAPDPATALSVVASVQRAARSGRIPAARLRDAAARVIDLKLRAGLLDDVASASSPSAPGDG